MTPPPGKKNIRFGYQHITTSSMHAGTPSAKQINRLSHDDVTAHNTCRNILLILCITVSSDIPTKQQILPYQY